MGFAEGLSLGLVIALLVWIVGRVQGYCRGRYERLDRYVPPLD